MSDSTLTGPPNPSPHTNDINDSERPAQRLATSRTRNACEILTLNLPSRHRTVPRRNAVEPTRPES
jgi:hypothetical protein